MHAAEPDALRELPGEIKKTSYVEGVKQKLAAIRIKDTRQVAGNGAVARP